MEAEIIAVGSEIMLGDIQNTHAQYLSVQLCELGIDVLFHTAVGDNEKRLTETVQTALSRCDLLIITGGLGPTKDDLTKEIVCRALEIPLKRDEKIQSSIERYFQKSGCSMTENNLRQADCPEGATILENPNGTAPGLIIQKGNIQVILLPGPPGELRPLFEQQVKPHLSKQMGKTILSHNIHVFDIGESKVDSLVADIMDGKNPTLGVYAKDGEVRLRATAKADSKEKCEEMLRPMIKEIRNRLDPFIYGIDVKSLENALVQTALKKKKTFALAESCTGGMVAQRVTSIPGASEVFSYGIVSYSNKIKEKQLGVKKKTLKKYSAVSSQTAEEMAEQARKKGKADVGISITGIAGPGGGSKEKPVGLVYIGVSTKEKCFSFKYLFARGLQNERDAIRNRACKQALDLARKAIDQLP